MQAFARDLPDRIHSLSGAARDLTETTARRARHELGRARDLSGALQRRLEGLMDRDTRRSIAHGAQHEIDRARDLGGALQQRLEGLVDRDTRRSVARGAQREIDRAKDLSDVLQRRLEGAIRRDRRSSRLPVVLSVAVVGVAIGGALLASPRVRASLRQGWDFLRRRPAPALLARTGSDDIALKPAHERQEDLLDEGIEESFPASDPVSVKRIT